MAVQTKREETPGRLQQIGTFLSAVNAEMKKVSWPNREELWEATKRITILAVALGVLIGLMDWALQKILVDGVAAIAR